MYNNNYGLANVGYQHEPVAEANSGAATEAAVDVRGGASDRESDNRIEIKVTSVFKSESPPFMSQRKRKIVRDRDHYNIVYTINMCFISKVYRNFSFSLNSLSKL